MSRFGSLSQPEYGEEEYITESLTDTSTGIEGSFLRPQSQRQTTGEEGILITGVPISSDLQVVNVGSQYYVIYDENKKDLFNSWWDNTSAKQLIASSDKKFHHPQWNNRLRTSATWKQFHQVAEHPSGTPKIICKICDTVLLHPTYTSHGTQGMNRHATSIQCKKVQKGNPNSDIVSAMVSTVMTQWTSNEYNSNKATFAYLGRGTKKTETRVLGCVCIYY
jgi:hypothetical protein